MKESKITDALDTKKKIWGDLRGRIRIADDFCAPLADMKEYMDDPAKVCSASNQ